MTGDRQEPPSTPSAGPPAGWYFDSEDRSSERYWNGHAWCEQRRPPIPTPYRQAAPIARLVKAVIQMLIGATAVVFIAKSLLLHPTHIAGSEGAVLRDIATALAISAAVELAFTLFTDGPDEALDPLMLGLSAALLLTLGKLKLDWTSGLAVLLLVLALAVLFCIRRWLADVQPIPEPEWLERLLQRHSREGNQTKNGATQSGQKMEGESPAAVSA